MLSRFQIGIGFLVGATVLQGCLGVPPSARVPSTPDRPPVSRVALPSSESVEGRPLEAFSMGNGPETILFVASIHGDESAGTPILQALAEHLEAQPEALAGKRVVFIPLANPDGVAHQRRSNAHGIDLNRNFPASNREDGGAYGPRALSEPESRFLALIFERVSPARVISIHQPLACVDWDGPAYGLAQEIAVAGRLPARKLGARPGSFGAWVGETLGVPIVTLELPGNLRMYPSKLWERYGPAVLCAITCSGEIHVGVD
jgi:protein MpaA